MRKQAQVKLIFLWMLPISAGEYSHLFMYRGRIRRISLLARVARISWLAMGLCCNNSWTWVKKKVKVEVDWQFFLSSNIYLELDPVGSTVLNEAMKLCTWWY